MLKKVFLLFIICSAVLSGAAAGSEKIRVAIADNQREVTIKSDSGLLLDGRSEDKPQKRMVFNPALMGSRAVRIKTPDAFIQFNGKSFRGGIELRKKPNGLLLVINELDLEDYLKGVVGAEMPYEWEFEALKAQAVASRSYAFYQKENAGKRPYHILATVNSQVYIGKSGERESAVRAVRETTGQVLSYEGRVIEAFYHSSCGGQTESALELWGIDEPYLRGVDCECQRISRYGVWEKTMAPEEVSASLGKIGFRLNGVSNVAIQGITPAGRVREVAIRHAGGVTLIPAERFRAAIGYSAIPSVFFEAEQAGNEITISGRGLGHGVGLCQWGAKEMAQRGFDYSAILKHYYPRTHLERKGRRQQ